MHKTVIDKKYLVIAEDREEKYVFELYVVRMSPNSECALINIDIICETYLKGRYELEIIDLIQQSYLALEEEIVGIPLLIKRFPLPEQRMIGDLSNTEMVLKGLRII